MRYVQHNASHGRETGRINVRVSLRRDGYNANGEASDKHRHAPVAVCLALFPESERAGTISAAINRLNSSIGDFLEYHVNRNIKPMYGTPISATQSSPQLANVHLPFLSSLRAHDVPAAPPAAEEDAKTNEEAAEEKQERARSSCTIEESVAPESPITAQ